MAFWDAAAGPIFGTIGSIAGGLLGGGKNKVDKWSKNFAERQFDESKRQFNLSFAWQRNRIRETVQDAERAGIHPLAALGASVPGGFAAGVGGSASAGGVSGWGDWAADALRNIGAGFESIYEHDLDAQEREKDREVQRGIQDDIKFQQIFDNQRAVGEEARAAERFKSEQRLIDAQIEEMQSRTLLNGARMLMQGGPATRGSAGTDVIIDAFGNRYPTGSETPAQTIADQWGDIISEAYGVANWIKNTFGPGGPAHPSQGPRATGSRAPFPR